MATSEKNQSEIINAWQCLIEQSVKANTAFLEESSKIFSTLLSKKIETKDLLKINTEFLKAAADNFIKLSVTNSENLMNFGVSLSRNMFSFIDKLNKNDADTSHQTQSHVTNTRNQINLCIKQGEQITTSFYLNSHNAFPQTGNFYYENFIDETSGEKAAITMSISPKEFTLESGKSIKVDITVGVTNDTAPGKYKAIVRLNGMDNQEFDIVAEVIENKLQVKQALKSKAATKKSPAKKSAVKKVAKK